MDLSTNYLGLTLKHPIIVGASPITHDIDKAKAAAEAGAAAIVMHSLFEEQILLEHSAQQEHIATHENATAEAKDYTPNYGSFAIGPDEYLEARRDQLRLARLCQANSTSRRRRARTERVFAADQRERIVQHARVAND
jgi:dihydroorotate dehydrogenase